MGDGILAEFDSTADAVICAIALRDGIKALEASHPDDEAHIRYRIGVNMGDVIADGGDVFGTGVNVAARIEALAPPGEILITRQVRDQIRDKLPIACEDLGEVSVKNILRPVRIFRIVPEAAATQASGAAPRRWYRADWPRRLCRFGCGQRGGSGGLHPAARSDDRSQLGDVDRQARDSDGGACI